MRVAGTGGRIRPHNLRYEAVFSLNYARTCPPCLHAIPQSTVMLRRVVRSPSARWAVPVCSRLPCRLSGPPPTSFYVAREHDAVCEARTSLNGNRRRAWRGWLGSNQQYKQVLRAPPAASFHFRHIRILRRQRRAWATLRTGSLPPPNLKGADYAQPVQGRALELPVGIEPTTCALQVRRSAN